MESRPLVAQGDQRLEGETSQLGGLAEVERQRAFHPARELREPEDGGPRKVAPRQVRRRLGHDQGALLFAIMTEDLADGAQRQNEIANAVEFEDTGFEAAVRLPGPARFSVGQERGQEFSRERQGHCLPASLGGCGAPARLAG